MSQMTPQEIVHELDKHIVGQTRAKRAVAIALRNRWRRQQVAEPLRQEITPKNILMIGPTGVGKTEIARRLARLADAPFIKVEATKFTEVGYVGRDVDAIVRDLAEIAIKDTRESAMKKVRRRAEDAAEERVLDVLLPGARRTGAFEPGEAGLSGKTGGDEESATRQKFRKKLREGELDERDIEVEVSSPQAHMEIFAPPGMEELTQQIQGMFQNLGGARKRLRKMKVRDAVKMLTDEEAARLVNDEDLRARALANVEQNGIVFLDEIDKIGEDRPYPVHRERRVSSVEALRPYPRAAGALSDPGRALFALGGGLREDPHGDRCLPHAPVPGAPCDRGGRGDVPARRHPAPRGDRLVGEREDREHRRAAPAYGDGEAARGDMEKLLEEISFEAGKRGRESVRIDAVFVDAKLKELAQSEDLARFVL